MAVPPFDIDEAVPADTDVVSQFPAAERTFRGVVESALAKEHDMGNASSTQTARHKFGRGSTASRDAIDEWVVGSIWFNTDFTPTKMQLVKSIGPVVWEDITITPDDAASVIASQVFGR